MCGIAGIVNLDKKPVDQGILRAMADVQKHRGPDDNGIYSGGHYGLSHTRLSIIDLSADAHQPMSNEDKTLYLVHNGEIYNYLELKDELVRLGHRFNSRSDTEVILHAYEQWGEGCLCRFNGMWAFAILDLKKKTLFASRDRFGVKPFYYFADKNIFLFSSEIKALLKHPAVKRNPNDAVIFDYLASGYGYMDTSDATFFDGIKQLKPAHYINVSLVTGEISQRRYWDLDPCCQAAFGSESEAFERFYSLFEDSIKLRLRSDVPVGVSLSGGLDSSAIACVASRLLNGGRLEAFSSCYEDEEYDERRFIRPVIERTNANANYVFTNPSDFFDDMEDILWHQDEPYSTLSIFPQWSVMKRAREKGVKVLLTGQGGDETLAGYHKYFYYLFADLAYNLKFGKAIKEIRSYEMISGRSENTVNKTAKIILSYMLPGSVKRSFGSNRYCPSYLNKDFVSRNRSRVYTEKRYSSILNNDLYNALKISPLPSLLHIDDRSSMAHSVESRSPFLDYRLVEYLFSLGPEYKIRDGVTKYILRRSLKDHMPHQITNRTDKMGYATPLEKWFRVNLKDKVLDILSSREFELRPYFDSKSVMTRFNNFVEGKEKNSHYTIWSWVNLELWLRKFIDAK